MAIRPYQLNRLSIGNGYLSERVVQLRVQERASR